MCIEVTLMLNEERVKHMVKLADYETKRGNEEMKISSYFKKDYISMNTLASLVWMTIAYILCIVAIWLSVREFVTVELTEPQNLSLVVLIVGLDLVLFIMYMVIARRFYKKKHARAYHRMKRFKEDLAVLERMYEKEDHDAETICD